jgi:hypothetical protein
VIDTETRATRPARAAEFGLTPASRSRAAVAADPAKPKPLNMVSEIAERIKPARAGVCW